MREQRQVVARLDVERGVHPEKVRDAVLITVRIVDKLPAPVMIFGDRQGDRPSRAIVAIQREAETMRELIVAHHSLNIFSEILFYRLSLYISRLQMYSFGLNIHEISRF